MAADPARIAQAWALLAELGVTLTDLQHDAEPARPTFDAYLPQVLAAAGPGALRTYRTYWQRMTTTWTGRAIGTVTASDIQAMRQQITDHAHVRRNSCDGRHAGELFVAAARAFYGSAGGIEETVAPIDVPERESPPVRPKGGRTGWRRARRAVVILAQVAVGQIMAWMLRHWFG